MLGFLKKIFHRGDDFDLDLDLSGEGMNAQENSAFNLNTNFNTGLNQPQGTFTQQTSQTLTHEEPSFLNPKAFIPTQPIYPSQQEDNIRQQLEILQSKIDMLNSKIDLILQRLQMLEQYFYYRR